VIEGARPAVRADLPRLTELALQAIEEARAQRGGPQLLRSHAASTGAPPDPASALGTYLDQPTDHVLVAATIDDVVLGMGAGRVAGPAPTVGLVDLVYVEPGARCVGLGAALIEHLQGWFRAAGCGAFEAPVLPGNRPAKQFFEGAGLVARLIVMHRAL
jgi:GNAT superfamily N-acetyltransferase